MNRQVVESIFNADRTRRVDIFERGDGTFGFEELKFVEDEQVWFTSGCYAVSFTGSAADAQREARGRVRWLSQTEG